MHAETCPQICVDRCVGHMHGSCDEHKWHTRVEEKPGWSIAACMLQMLIMSHVRNHAIYIRTVSSGCRPYASRANRPSSRTTPCTPGSLAEPGSRMQAPVLCHACTIMSHPNGLDATLVHLHKVTHPRVVELFQRLLAREEHRWHAAVQQARREAVPRAK